VEGATDDAALLAQRALIRRNLVATTLFSLGTPMLLAGDEFGQSQDGNNNAYCQDNALSWLDWSLLQSEAGREMHDFVARLLALRHANPLLRVDYFQHAQREFAPGLRDVFWFDERGCELQELDWHNTNARLLGLRRAALQDDGRRVGAIILLTNSDSATHEFHLPGPDLDYALLVDTARPAISDEPVVDNRVAVAAHSLVLLVGNLALQDIKPSHVDCDEALAESNGSADVAAMQLQAAEPEQEHADATLTTAETADAGTDPEHPA
jgi:glycogen operon protein